ncbi:MAG: HAMP domain-containing sensor histidine kinase [Desulfuromonadales bacterium]
MVKKLFPSLGVAGLALLLFILDLHLPLGVSAGTIYVVVVLLAAWLPLRQLMLIAALCTALTLAGFFGSSPGGVLWMAIVNRGIAIGAIWIIAYFAYQRRRSEDTLRQVNAELNSFVHTVSHDLRSPISPILGYADFLREEYGECLDETAKTALDEIESQGFRMLGLLDDLLQLAMVGHLERPVTPVDVNRVLRDVARTWREKVDGDGGRLLCDELPSVAIAESLLFQVFDNLIGNAARYAPGSLIEIGGERDGTRVRYFVRDHGPGIPPDEQESIFEPFQRGKLSRPIPGTGIGLATVRKIAVTFGGRAWVEDTPGGGSTFLVELMTAKES